jgi:hypothetical protein
MMLREQRPLASYSQRVEAERHRHFDHVVVTLVRPLRRTMISSIRRADLLMALLHDRIGVINPASSST